MVERSKISPGDWITIGKGTNKIQAVVCAVYRLEPQGEMEVVYLNEGERAISADVVWDYDHWSFKGPPLSGGDEENSERLCNFVSKLRTGRS